MGLSGGVVAENTGPPVTNSPENTRITSYSAPLRQGAWAGSTTGAAPQAANEPVYMLSM